MVTYVEAFLEQVLVSVACNGAHDLKHRLARWLLMMRDRSDVIPCDEIGGHELWGRWGAGRHVRAWVWRLIAKVADVCRENDHG
jgi:hypothetical protein